MTTPNLDSIFEQQAAGGGGGAPSYAFPKVQERGKLVPQVGHVVQGTITDIFATVVKDIDTGDPKRDKNGNEQPQINITLETTFRNWEAAIKPGKDEEGNELPASADEGQRRIYAKHRMLQAIAKAVKESGNSGAPKVGGKLAVRVKGLVWDEKNPTRNPLPDYDAVYKAPEPGQVAADAAFNAAAVTEPATTRPASNGLSAPAQQPDAWAAAMTGDKPPF